MNYCKLCEGRLVPIGNARINGADHYDWNTRLYHKKCWLEIKYPRCGEKMDKDENGKCVECNDVECDGSGKCFRQKGLDSYEQRKCNHKCEIKCCPRCYIKLPEWVLDCNKGFCMNCAAHHYYYKTGPYNKI